MTQVSDVFVHKVDVRGSIVNPNYFVEETPLGPSDKGSGAAHWAVPSANMPRGNTV